MLAVFLTSDFIATDSDGNMVNTRLPLIILPRLEFYMRRFSGRDFSRPVE